MNQALRVVLQVCIVLLYVVSRRLSFGCSNHLREAPDKMSDEDSGLLVSLHPDSKLWSAPGTKHDIELIIRQTGGSYGDLWISYQEEFSSIGHHVQIVQDIQPRFIRNSTLNQTWSAILTLDIPDYVHPTSQFKITVTAHRLSSSNLAKISFYFTVSHVSLAKLDWWPPICQPALLCPDRKRSECSSIGRPFCAHHFWHSEIEMSDNVTGISNIRVTSPGSSLIHPDLLGPIGSTRKFKVTLKTQCCFPGAEITVTDVAGNVGKCVSGINPNAAQILNSSNILLLFFVSLHRIACFALKHI